MSQIVSFKTFFSQLVTSPAKVAKSLNKKKCSGSVLNLDICKDRINLAVASHPQYREPMRMLNPINLSGHTFENRKILDDEVSSELGIVIRDFNVCGIVVGWPVEKEGWCGSPCGRVLHTLDQLSISAERHGLFSTAPEFPICLYDMNHYLPDEDDEWGRSTVYCSTTKKMYIISSEQQNRERNSYNVSDIWNDFSRTYWSDLDKMDTTSRGSFVISSANSSNHFLNWFDAPSKENKESAMF